MVEVCGDRLETRWLGPRPGEAPTLVFLHEGLGSLAQWRDFPAELAARTGYGALVYSRAGYGGSSPAHLPWTPRFLHDEALRALPALLAQYGIADPILFGHSDGASIALIHAGHAGAGLAPRPRALVLEAPHVFVEPVCRDSIRALAGRFAADASWRERFARHHVSAAATVPAWCRIWLDAAFRAWNIEAVLPAIRCPVLALQGEQDEYGTPAQLARLAAGLGGPSETHLLAGCGHSPHRDRESEVLNRTVEFLARVPG